MPKGYHNILLHKNPDAQPPNNKELKVNHETLPNSNNAATQLAVIPKLNSASASLSYCSIKGSHQVLLSIAVLWVRDRDGTLHGCRALLDNGSQSKFITQKLANKLNLSQETINASISGIGDMPIRAIQQIHATIQSRTTTYFVKLHNP